MLDIDRIIAIGTLSITTLVGISNILLMVQQIRVARLDVKLKKEQLKKIEKRPSSSQSPKRKKKGQK